MNLPPSGLFGFYEKRKNKKAIPSQAGMAFFVAPEILSSPLHETVERVPTLVGSRAEKLCYPLRPRGGEL